MRARSRRLPLAAVAAIALLAPVPAASAQGTSTLRSQLASAFRGASRASSAYVQDLDTGRALFSARATTARIPASVNKLYTTSTAILRLGASARFTTTVLATGPLLPDGTLQGDLVLHGGGDPSLSDAGIASLAAQVGATGVLRVQGRVVGDESIFDPFRGGPRTGFAYDSDVGGVLSGLTVGRGWSAKGGGPAAEASRRLAAALKRIRVSAPRAGVAGVAPAGSSQLGALASPTVAELVRATLVPSDNFYAETLLKDLGAYAAGSGTTGAGAAVVRDQMAQLGLRPRYVDGSGLSRADATSPAQVVGLLREMHDRPEGQILESSLAIAGRTGTVSRRLRGTAAQGRCRTKTGTLRDVSALAGICATPAGRTVAFAFLMNRTSVTSAHRVQDRMAAALARYSG